jgi:hypothetical protein
MVLAGSFDEEDGVAAPSVVKEPRKAEVVEAGREAHGRTPPWSVAHI